MVRNSPHNLGKRPLSTRKALLVWFGCALTGWLVAIFSIYGVLQFGDRVVAALSDSDDVQITDQEGRAAQEIAPAAGGTD
jgi:hypothetical protein